MALKALIAAVALAAVCVAFILPAPHGGHARAKSQIEQIEIR